ncbi:MAG TPA: tRNA uridine-5-carboxymethylaminomethyl(34) synthesis GTPase MnmE, partial [Rhodospirillaceae bacterium]|nr:tRNA uridine-5-carboxymethylaminomethyl(34) synthesis GTPase MnmE [Rhodospirillaceae bacterium]
RLELKFENQILDDAIALYFAAPNSFTGEDVVELNLHGGRAVVQGVLAALGKMDGLRLAEPGEFTRRAFENEKLDLTQAEAIADLIHAETSLQRAQALGQLGGGLSDLYHGWAGRLTKLLAHAEAEIDFPDEDLPDGINQKLTPDIQTMISELQNHLNDGRRGERLRDGIQIAIIGAPNAGKSTLLNALAQRDVAIVTEIAGTTRDVIEVHLDLGGYPVTLLDTAGLRATDDIVEAEGIRRAHSRARDADLKLCLFDSRMEPDAATHALVDENSIVVLTKNDLAQSGIRGIDISATNGKGIDDLLAEMTRRLEEIFSTVRDVPSLTRARHREALEETLSALQRAITAQSAELIAEDLRLALRALGRITGRVDVEDLLDKIFRDFCIGK